MSLKTRNVSKKYALHEFRTVGLVLILYCLFVLYVPLLLKEIKPLLDSIDFFGLNIYSLANFVCILLGTTLPFFILRLYRQMPLKSFINNPYISFKESFANCVVFFAFSSALMFVTMMVSQYVNVSGQLVSSIGIVINEEYLNDFFYILAFVVVTPIIEEYAFRGCLLNSLSIYGKYFALSSVSIVYALAHGSFVEMIPAFFMSMMLSKMALRYKTIIPGIVAHICFNLIIYILFLVPETYSLIVAIIFAIIFLLVVVLIITRTYKHVTIKKSNSNKQVTLTFLSSIPVVVAMLLFILHSVLLTIM